MARADTPLTLTEDDLAHLRGLNERVSLDDVVEIYLPLSRLLNLHVGASQALHGTTATFLGTSVAKAPFVIGLAGSVAVGKSTTARIMRALLARWPNHTKVDLVATDGFLYPRRVLEERAILHRKGFPESYDLRALNSFLSEIKAGRPELAVPIYGRVPEPERDAAQDAVLLGERGAVRGGEQPGRRDLADGVECAARPAGARSWSPPGSPRPWRT